MNPSERSIVFSSFFFSCEIFFCLLFKFSSRCCKTRVNGAFDFKVRVKSHSWKNERKITIWVWNRGKNAKIPFLIFWAGCLTIYMLSSIPLCIHVQYVSFWRSFLFTVTARNLSYRLSLQNDIVSTFMVNKIGKISHLPLIKSKVPLMPCK